ncbi:hypothetical protein Pelo_15089 [Pelomyxa schiedti]|nr:hypothetical protein Pelo_15089 [Pelomyxa schiedti]
MDRPKGTTAVAGVVVAVVVGCLLCGRSDASGVGNNGPSTTQSFWFSFPDWMPNCPPSIGGYHYVSSTVVSFLVFLVCGALAIITVIKYHGVKLQRTMHKPPGVSNTMWISFFLSFGTCAAFRGLLLCFGYGHDALLTALKVIESVCLCTSGLFISLAVDYQRRFKSSHLTQTRVDPRKGRINEAKPLLSYNRHIVDMPCNLRCQCPVWTEVVFVLIMLQFLVVLLFLLAAELDSKGYYVVFLISLTLEFLPIVIVTIVLLVQRPVALGPSIASRIFLGVGILFVIVTTAPAFTWALVLPHHCIEIFSAMSWFDIINLGAIPGLLFLFIFVRAEYYRQQKEYIWHFVTFGQAGFQPKYFDSPGISRKSNQDE